jgi:hypothetical protein
MCRNSNGANNEHLIQPLKLIIVTLVNFMAAITKKKHGKFNCCIE